MNDEKLTKLIRKAIKGDITAFEEVMKLKARQIIYISMKTTRNRQDGEDAAQEAMLKMYQSIGSLKDPDAFYTWMYQIVTRTCIDLERKNLREDCDYLDMKVELNEMRREFLPQDYVEDVDKRETLLKVIDDLPPTYRTVLLFFYYEQLSYQEISEILEISEKSISNILHRAKLKIREQMERRHSLNVSLSSFKKAAAVPVLGQAFQLDAAQLPAELVDKILSGAGIGSGMLVAQATGGVSAAKGASTVTAMSTTTKVAIGVIAATTAAGGVAWGFFPGHEASSAALAVYSSTQEDEAILTLADMIGEEAADQLTAFCQGQGSLPQWEEFLASLAAVHISGVDDGAANYLLYQLERQDKQLLLLQQETTEDFQVAYHFTDRQEVPPEGPELRTALERWQQ